MSYQGLEIEFDRPHLRIRRSDANPVDRARLFHAFHANRPGAETLFNQPKDGCIEAVIYCDRLEPSAPKRTKELQQSHHLLLPFEVWRHGSSDSVYCQHWSGFVSEEPMNHTPRSQRKFVFFSLVPTRGMPFFSCQKIRFGIQQECSGPWLPPPFRKDGTTADSQRQSNRLACPARFWFICAVDKHNAHYHGRLAQRLVQPSYTRQVLGSNPRAPTKQT